MEKTCRLWSPVVYAELKELRKWKGQFYYTTEEAPGRLEDIKIKPRRCTARIQGRHIEVEIASEVLTLLENPRGQMRLFARGESFRERISQDDFTAWPDETGLDFVVNLQRLSWDGEIRDREIHINLIIFYNVMIIRNEIVRVQMEAGSETDELMLLPEEAQDLLAQLQNEIIQAEAAKMELKRKIRLYEKDIQSLKKGINRAEGRNLDLKEELSKNRLMVEQLSQRLQEKDSRTGHYEKAQTGQGQGSVRTRPQETEELVSLGGFIKRLFQSNA